MATAFFILKINESKENFNVNMYRRANRLDLHFKSDGGKYGTNLSAGKIIGISDINENQGYLISFQMSVKDEFYYELNTLPLSTKNKIWDQQTRECIGEVSNDAKVVDRFDSKAKETIIDGNKIELAFFSDKKSLSSALTNYLGKNGLKMHKINGDAVELLKKIGGYEKFTSAYEKLDDSKIIKSSNTGDFVRLDNIEAIKCHKLFNPELENNKEFCDALSLDLARFCND